MTKTIRKQIKRLRRIKKKDNAMQIESEIKK